MIAKPFTDPAPTDTAGHAGWLARKQMAFYLDLSFVNRDDGHVFHGLRLEHAGRVVEIDHLVMHRLGFTLIESRSVTGQVTLDPAGQLTRSVAGAPPAPLPSPVDRVRNQAGALYDLLNAHPDVTRRAQPCGDERFTVLVAVADRGRVRYESTPPPEMMRADQINQAVNAHLDHRLDRRGLIAFIRFMRTARHENRSVSPFTDSDQRSLHGFLLAQHRPPAKAATPLGPDAQSETARRSPAEARKVFRYKPKTGPAGPAKERESARAAGDRVRPKPAANPR